ncbi:histidine kinase [Alkalimonas sp.]|uniref:histidine kinase n=1 Tax=Alkalimonas sp. TaxID=1872453 RepID=UPI00263BCE22|nr:histidine kinase [Alkalimonas sp.]MCC5826550.1 type IV pili methyl-accepting chemotaxis transducer N-terminal domain-containing protein [Alkalimonas sp.]
MRPFSVVTRINIALACIVTLALTTMMVSYWLSDKADSDAHAVNVAGSLRMQSYRLAWLKLQQEPEKLSSAKQQLNNSWQHPVFKRFLHQPEIQNKYDLAHQHWLMVAPLLTVEQADIAPLELSLTEQVRLLDELVLAIQQDAEQKVRAFRTVQVVAVLATILLSIIVMYWLRVMVQEPLEDLIKGARRIAQGDFTHRITPQHPDELGTLAHSFNKMNGAIGYMYGNLEKRVQQQTEALQHSNTRLQFLFDIARSISEHSLHSADFSKLITELQDILTTDELELCLLTEQGSSPYLQVQPEQNPHMHCVKTSCQDCVSQGQDIRTEQNQLVYRFPLDREQHHYGVLVSRQAKDKPLQDWQQQLLQSVADLLALALSLKGEEEQVRRLALMQERSVIARELHDSLAQSLSYLKIQVTRLNKGMASDNKAMLKDVADELKEGLSSAYRQLRELLTTFRLKVDGAGLQQALQTTVKQLTEQSTLRIRLDYRLEHLPLTPTEEIHLLQIIREASQNAVHHSQGSELSIELRQGKDKAIELRLEDNGVGLPAQPEKLNHYGLAIMQERSRQLGGDLQLKNRPEGGTGLYFRFIPECMAQLASA